MKFNLKNKPWFANKEVKKWFEGFEKELREHLDNPAIRYVSAEQYIKEILGE